MFAYENNNSGKDRKTKRGGRRDLFSGRKFLQCFPPLFFFSSQHDFIKQLTLVVVLCWVVLCNYYYGIMPLVLDLAFLHDCGLERLRQPSSLGGSKRAIICHSDTNSDVRPRGTKRTVTTSGNILAWGSI